MEGERCINYVNATNFVYNIHHKNIVLIWYYQFT